jgi:hypothetical protein
MRFLLNHTVMCCWTKVICLAVDLGFKHDFLTASKLLFPERQRDTVVAGESVPGSSIIAHEKSLPVKEIIITGRPLMMRKKKRFVGQALQESSSRSWAYT